MNVFNTLNFEKEKSFSKNQISIFQLTALRLKTYHFHTKLSLQKPMLRKKKNREYKMDLSQRTEFCQ